MLTVTGPHGPNFMGKIWDSKNPQKEFGMLVPTLPPIIPGKGFRNPNYVNNFNKLESFNQNSLQSDSLIQPNRNSCHRIINIIKEKCPEAIPCAEDWSEEKKIVSITESDKKMCLEKNKTRIQKRRDYVPKQRKPVGKKLWQNLNKNEISEMMDETANQNLSNHSLDRNLSHKPQALVLQDFILSKPVPKIHVILKRMDQIEIPISKGKDMQVTVMKPSSGNQSRQCSVSDNEDSSIIFDHNLGSEEYICEDKNDKTDKNKSPYRKRLPSLCESEDSFIMFDRGSVEDLDDDISFESTSEDSDQESCSEESDVDDVNSSFFIVDHKRVRFASNDKLCKVHPMIKWSYAYQAARKGPWEMYARDRSRFKERALRVERDIKHIFDSQHRAKIYRERFENL